jgi:hypothetical protein
MNMLRHVGKIANTDERCVIAFMQIPQRENHALVIPTDTLPPRFEQAVMDIVRSAEGQNEETLAVALSRRLMPDTGKDIFATLHENRMLRAVPIEQVLMLPMPNQPIRLTDILEQMGRLPTNQSLHGERIEKFNPHMSNLEAGKSEQKRGIAQNLLVEAALLEADAHRKREQAYSYDPSLRPQMIKPPVAEAKPEVSTADAMAAMLPPVEPVEKPFIDPSLDALLRD